MLACTFMYMVPAFSQSVSNYLISNAGKTDSGNKATVSWSLGEVTVSSTATHQGYQFPGEIQSFITAVEEQLATRVKLFPNPSFDVLHLEIEEPSNVVGFQIHNSRGQKVKEIAFKKGNNIQLDLRELTSGIYYVRVLKRDKESTTYKIIKK